MYTKLKKNKIFNIYSVWKQYMHIYCNLLLKFNFNNINMLPKIGNIIITVKVMNGIKNDTDVKIVNILYLVDYFTNNKASIEKLLTKYIRKNKTIVFLCKSTLSSLYENYLLFFYLKYSIFPYLKKKINQ